MLKMPRIIAVILFLMIAMGTAAPTVKTTETASSTDNSTIEGEDNLSSMAPVESKTFTIEIDNDVILTTDPDGLAFTEYTESSINSTEEPLPDSVLQQLEREREEQKKREDTTIDPINATITVPTSTVRNYVTIKRTTSKPLPTTTETVFERTTTGASEVEEEEEVETTENIDPQKSINSYFGKLNVAEDLKNIKSEEEDRETEPPLFDDLTVMLNENDLDSHYLSENNAQLVDTRQILQSAWEPTVEPFIAAESTTEAELPSPTTIEENEEVTTTEAQSPLPTTIKVSTTEAEITTVAKQDAADIVTNKPEVSTVVPSTTNASETEITTTKSEELLKNLDESSIGLETTEDSSISYTTSNPEYFKYTTFVPESASSVTYYSESFGSSSSAPETTDSFGTTNIPVDFSSTTYAPDTTESTSTNNYPASFSYTTLSPEAVASTTNSPGSFSYTTFVPEATSSTSTSTTTFAPETTSSSDSTTNLAPEITTSTSSTTTTTTTTTTLAPETTPSIVTTTTSEPHISTTKQEILYNESLSSTTTSTTTSTTEAPTTTTTTPRPIQTRAPRIERIFNSDGVEVLYGYSSVVRTNRLN